MASRISMKRATAGIAVVVLIAAILPACALLCCGVQTTGAARVMAMMPCCANTPAMHSPRASGTLQDATLPPVPKAPVLVAIAVITPVTVTAPATSVVALQYFQPDSALATSTFLRNEQFRI